MADSIREKIVANLLTTLQTVTIANGYVNTIAKVERWEQDGNDHTSTPMAVIAVSGEEKEQEPIGLATVRMQVDIDIYVRHDKADFANSTDALLASLLADVEKALMVDHTRGANALDTEITGNVSFETQEGQPLAGIIVELEVQYRHSITDPASVT